VVKYITKEKKQQFAADFAGHTGLTDSEAEEDMNVN
jgi:hypothetical protein